MVKYICIAIFFLNNGFEALVRNDLPINNYLHCTAKYRNENDSVCSTKTLIFNDLTYIDMQNIKCSKVVFEKKYNYPIAVINNYGLLYDFVQYEQREYLYVVYADNMGYMPAVEVHFGNGDVIKQDTEYSYFQNFKMYLDTYNILSMDHESEQKYTFNIRHQYNKFGTYNLTVKIFNNFYEVSRTFYTINVLELKDCDLNINVENNNRNYYRFEEIYFLGNVVTKCFKPTFSFEWLIYQSIDQTNDDRLLNMSTQTYNSSYLLIRPFTLPFGKYHVIFSVEMLFPLRHTKKISVRFEILRKNIVLLIDGGETPNMYYNSTSILKCNAIDPNFENNFRPNFTYSWKIITLNKYVQNLFSTKGIISNNSMLVIPPNTFKPETNYLFSVIASHAHLGQNYAAKKVQKVYYTYAKLPTVIIKCIHNCLESMINAEEVSVFEEDYLFYMKTFIKMKTWNIYELSSHYEHKDMLIYAKSSKDLTSNNLLLEKGFLKHNRTYRIELVVKIQLSGTNEENYSENSLIISTYPKPVFETCYVNPPFGYGLFTAFNISCMLKRQVHRFHIFEITHIRNFNEQDWFNSPIGINTNGNFSKVTLVQGLKKYNFVTTLRVSAVNDLGVKNYHDVNVSVLPFEDYLKTEAHCCFDELKKLFRFEDQLLENLITYKDYYGIMHRVSVISYTFTECISTVSNNISRSYIEEDTLKLKRLFFSCLRRIPINALRDARYVISSLHSIIIIPICFDVKLDLVRSTELLEKVVENLISRRSTFNDLMKFEIKNIKHIIFNVASQIIENYNYLDYDTEKSENRNIKQYLQRSLDTILHFVHIFNSDKMPKEAVYKYFRPNLAVLSQHSYPEYLFSRKQLLLENIDHIMLDINKMHLDNKSLHNFIILTASYREKRVGSYNQIAMINLTEEQKGTLLPVRVELSMPSVKFEDLIKVNGQFSVKKDIIFEDIQSYKITVPVGKYLFVKFKPLPCQMNVNLVHTINRPPELADFTKDVVELPQTGQGWSFMTTSHSEEYNYIGFLLNKPSLQRIFNCANGTKTDCFDNSDSSNCSLLNYITYEKGQVFLPFTFSAYAMHCQSTYKTVKDCYAKLEPFGKVTCVCDNGTNVDLILLPTSVIRTYYITIKIRTKFRGGVLLIFIILYCFILAVHFGLLAYRMDENDTKAKQITYLDDNYPTNNNTYMVVVYTGKQAEAGTTSNIAISLEGTNATSIVHILKSTTKQVLERSGHDWFILKTNRNLGEIYCIHVWSDFSGAKPSWYCDRIVVHDTETNGVWFFIAQQWFSFLHGNGYLSVSIYLTSQSKILTTSYKLFDRMVDEYESGTPAVYSVLDRHPYSNFSRLERVGLALTYILTIIFMLSMINHHIVQRSTEHHKWDFSTALDGLYAALMAQPIACFFLIMFRCVRPIKESYNAKFFCMNTPYIHLSEAGSSYSIFSYKLHRMPSRALKKKDEDKVSSEHDSKKVTFKQNFMDDENQDTRSSIKRHNYVTNLEQQAMGRSAIVPLREHLTNVEEEASIKGSIHARNYNVHKFNYNDAVQSTHCLPHVVRTFLWGSMITIWIVTCAWSVYQDFKTKWMYTTRICMSLIFSVIVCFGILEPLKLIITTIYLYLRRPHNLYLEDRTDLISDLQPPPLNAEDEAARIDLLDKNQGTMKMYRPISRHSLERVYKASQIESTYRDILIDLLVLIMMCSLLILLMQHLAIPLRQLHTKDLQEKFKPAVPIRTIEDIENFLKMQVIEQYPSDLFSTEKEITISNRVIGVTVIKQIRFAEDACLNYRSSWSARCDFDRFSKKNYYVGWTQYKEDNDIPPELANPWKYTESVVHRKLSPLGATNSSKTIPNAGYIAKLFRDKRRSMKVVLNLIKNGWLDDFSAYILMEVYIFNVNMRYITKAITIIERTPDNSFFHRVKTFLFQMEIIDVHVEVIRIAIVAFLLVFVIFYAIRQIVRIKYSSRENWLSFGGIFFLVDMSLIGLAVIGAISFMYKINLIDSINENYNVNNFEIVADFISEETTSRVNTLVVGFTFVIICFRLWSPLVNLMSNFLIPAITIKLSTIPIVFFFSVLLVFVLGFASFSKMIFAQYSYTYYSWRNSFLTVFALAQTNSFYVFYHMYDIGLLTKMFCLVTAMLLFLILRCLVCGIIVYNYQFVKMCFDVRLQENLFGGRFLGTRILLGNRDYSIYNLFSKPRPFYRTRLVAMDYITQDILSEIVRSGSNDGASSSGNSKHTDRVMALIALGTYLEVSGEERWQFLGAHEKETPADELRREIWAKHIARTHVAFDALQIKLDYLDFQLKESVRRTKYEVLGPHRRKLR